MAKRVHELAKELDKSNKDVLDFLAEKGHDVKSHMSVLTDEAEAQIRGVFGKKDAAEAPADGEEKPKKKNIIRVFRSQNASGKIPERKQRPEGKRPEGKRPEGKRPEGKKPEAAKPVQPKPEAPKAEDPKVEVPRQRSRCCN